MREKQDTVDVRSTESLATKLSESNDTLLRKTTIVIEERGTSSLLRLTVVSFNQNTFWQKELEEARKLFESRINNAFRKKNQKKKKNLTSKRKNCQLWRNRENKNAKTAGYKHNFILSFKINKDVLENLRKCMKPYLKNNKDIKRNKNRLLRNGMVQVKINFSLREKKMMHKLKTQKN